MKQYEHLDELPDAVFGSRAPRNSGVRCSTAVQGDKVRIEGQHHATFVLGKTKLLWVRDFATSCLLRRKNVDSAASQALNDRSWVVLIGKKANRVSHLSSRGTSKAGQQAD